MTDVTIIFHQNKARTFPAIKTSNECLYLLHVQEMLAMSLSCMELQLEQWSHNKGKTGKYHFSSDSAQADQMSF